MDEQNKEIEVARNRAVLFGNIVYYGGVLFSTVLFIAFVLSAFPADAYVMRLALTFGGLMVGASGLAFPYALHHWAVSGAHQTAARLFYYGEMGILGANIVIAFTKLLEIHAGWAAPAWVNQFEPYTVGAVVYTIAAWGTLFILDPISTAKAQQIKNAQQFESRVAERMADMLDDGALDGEIHNQALERLGKIGAASRRKSGLRTPANTFQSAASVGSMENPTPANTNRAA